jgi:streptomycin 6-kinase
MTKQLQLAGWHAKAKANAKQMQMLRNERRMMRVVAWWDGTGCSGTERISSGGMLQGAVVLRGFHLVVCYRVQWY